MFRFNREFYELNDKGRPERYRNLRELRRRVAPIVLRRRKADVESQLPERTDHFRFVELTRTQRELYDEHRTTVAKLSEISKRRPLTEREQIILQKELAAMRMLCDTPYILDQNDRTCPKLAELDSILDLSLADPDVKMIIFSEWVRMLDLVRDRLQKKQIGFASHTGRIPQDKRRRELHVFKRDPDCRILLCSEAGGVGLNLQNASVVVNCDLPWNPAKLEQRIARAWRKNQSRPVTVINLVARDTIEHGMLVTLQDKQELAAGLLDHANDLDKVRLRRGGQTFLKRLQQVLFQKPRKIPPSEVAPVTGDPVTGFVQACAERLGADLRHAEEHYPEDESEPSRVLLVVQAAELARPKINAVYKEWHPRADSLGPFEVECIDPAAWETIQHLTAAGILRSTARTRRLVLPGQSRADAGPDPVLQAEFDKALEQSNRATQAARLLLNAGLSLEAGEHVRNALLAATRAAAIRSDALRPESWDDLNSVPGRRLLSRDATWFASVDSADTQTLDDALALTESLTARAK